jgi:hypothetical protein
MVNIRSYGAGVITGLVSLSQGTCYWPDCEEPIVRFVNGRPVNNFETAHIRAANEGGQRYVGGMTDAERNDFQNLVLLCLVHHKIVDKLQPDDFSIETLETWKRTRETPGQAALRGLRGLTEDRLQEMIGESFQSFRSEFSEVLGRLEQIDREAANLLRPLINELAEARFHARFPDADTANTLAEAARKLGHLQDTAGILAGAADDLLGLQDTATVLTAAAKEFRTARQFM